MFLFCTPSVIPEKLWAFGVLEGIKWQHWPKIDQNSIKDRESDPLQGYSHVKATRHNYNYSICVLEKDNIFFLLQLFVVTCISLKLEFYV